MAVSFDCLIVLVIFALSFVDSFCFDVSAFVYVLVVGFDLSGGRGSQINQVQHCSKTGTGRKDTQNVNVVQGFHGSSLVVRCASTVGL